MVNRVALVFKGIKRTILLSDCIHSFIDFAGIAKRRSWGGEKRKLAMDSANESMYEDRRNKIPPSFRTNFPLEEEGIVYLILLESHFPKARSCVAIHELHYFTRKKRKERKELEEQVLKTY